MTRRTAPTTALATAAAIRALPAVTGLEELWQQRPGETSAEYHDFLDWLDQGASRGAPPERCRAAAARYEWAERALAYERAWALSKADQATPAEAQITSNLLRMVQIETKKLLEQSARDTAPVVPLKDLLGTVNLIMQMQQAGLAAQTAATDLSKLSKDQLETVLRAQRILRDTKK